MFYSIIDVGLIESVIQSRKHQENQEITTLMVNLVTFWCIKKQHGLVHHLFPGRNVNPYTYKLRHPAAQHPILCSHIISKNPTPLSPTSITHFLSFLIISIHPSLVGASQRGLSCCVEGILGLWRQFGNEARLHLNTLLFGHLVNLMRGGWGEQRGEMERTREVETGGGKRQRE